MHILIYGVGGVGGFFGGKLVESDHKVTMLARGAHLKAIQQKGLTVHSISGDFTAIPYRATDSLSEIEPPDLVIFGVKSWQLVAAAKSCLPLVKKHTLFLPLQNGADTFDKLVSVLPASQVLKGLCRMISYVDQPGVIHNPDISPSLLFGEESNQKTKRAKDLLRLFQNAGIDAAIPENIDSAIWQKFLFITTISGIGGLCRVPIGAMRKSEYIFSLMRKTAEEIQQIALAKNIELPADTIDQCFKAIGRQAYNTTASTQRDIMEGKPSELEDFNGYIVREGLRLQIPTPVNSLIYQLLLPQEKQARHQE